MAGIPSTILTALLMELDRLVDPAADTKAMVRVVRRSVGWALTKPGFSLACIERVLDGLDPGHVGWQYPKIHSDPFRRYSVCIFHWPPGLANTPHRHNTWTVTGVLHNSLQFNTYRIEPTGSALVPEKRVNARPGDVGYICTPCIHNVVNPNAASSFSLHIFGHPQTAGAAIDLIEYPMEGTVRQPRGSPNVALDGRIRENVLASCAKMIGAHAHPCSLPLLYRIFQLAQARAKLVALKAMSGLDPLYAADQAPALAEVLVRGPAAVSERVSGQRSNISHNQRR